MKKTVDNKNAISAAPGRNELTVFIDNKIQTIAIRPGIIKWHSDKILKNAATG